MLRTACSNISIITNFGCRSECWYCIWKGHELERVQEETDWSKLEQFLIGHGKVSVSGGGDCLYCYDKYKPWWGKLFEITDRLGMLVDVHTREQFMDEGFWSRIHKCVFSCDKLTPRGESYLRWLRRRCLVRVCHLVTADTTGGIVEDLIKFTNSIDAGLTLKQLAGYNDFGRFEQMIRLFPDVYCLPSGDYNTYYMPDNSIRTTFLS